MTLRQILKTEVRYWLPMVFITYVLINGYLSGWTSWVVPDVSVPIIFDGDALYGGVVFQRQIEGFWYFENMRFGYPFVSTQYDFPMSFLDVVTGKIIGQIVTSWYGIYTLYVVFGFVVNAVVSYAVMRAMDINVVWAIVGACLFNMVPFHFYRIQHIFYTIYVAVPLVYYMAWQLWQGHSRIWQRHNIVPSIMIGFVLGGYIIYYAVFALIVIGITTVIVTLHSRSARVWWSGVAVMATIVLGIVSGNLPPLIYQLSHPNTIFLTRAVEDSVILALKPIALFTFVPPTYLYGDTYMHILGINWNEFHANSILGSLGVVLVLWGILSVWLNRHVTLFMRFFGFQFGVLLMYCTVGGGGWLDSKFVGDIDYSRHQPFCDFCYLYWNYGIRVVATTIRSAQTTISPCSDGY